MALRINGNVVIDDSRNALFTNFVRVGTPRNLSPTAGQTSVQRSNLVLSASSYEAFYKGIEFHRFSRWQVANASTFATNTIVVDSGNVAGSNTYTITTTLPGSTVLHWRVNYVNNSNIVSSFSTSTSFTTAA